ncbi:2-hydroxy-3-oxopropionate reductase [Thermobaculum terrenum ATCC BAA-798]|uniref:2-hydroxy-3-oxopropionate reductase n=1 Tax=Thermobaculum terrenum (strain ATCC BAA-798 / CCMEE 7001 / YNP1) TaxID=525904 RepID=D1CGF8_THET1|nr:2-hydroxy-3-oxopropionate reductase [Thermobaculum terrenum]ACZ42829.1 2-hydroxy-3-oxopropionate reductase [Thermobaculum terrenum ATCC BAA-798]
MERIGFIGLGIMGKPMARNLLKAGYQLVVHNRSRGPVEELQREGAEGAGSPAEVAERSDVIITMLPDTPDVRQVVEGEQGVLEGIRQGSLLIDMSTISPIATREIASRVEERGARMLDAPVSGGDVGAQQGTLSIMVGGREEDFQRALPIFQVLGKTITYLGPSGSGQVVKACNQIVVALTIEAVSEALVLGAKAGVDPAKIVQVLMGGMAGNRVLEMRKDNFLGHTFNPGFKVALHHKDLGIALQTGRELGVPLPATALVDQAFAALEARGRSQQDHTALITFIEELASYSPQYE